MSQVFNYLGKYGHSSQIPFVDIGGARANRDSHWKALINERMAQIPASTHPVYIATGGGYGSFDGLIGALQKTGVIDASIPSVKGHDFRHDSVLAPEKDAVRAALRQHLSPQNPALADAEAVEQLLSGFYSDEMNTKLVKGVLTADGQPDKRFPKGIVLRCFDEGKSVIHESASIYPETTQRADLAHAAGHTACLIAGTRALGPAIEALKSTITPYMIATSYKKFATLFASEYIQKFDAIKLYDTDQSPPQLIAEKKLAGPGFEIYAPERYNAFLAQQNIDVDQYAKEVDTVHTLSVAHADVAKTGNPYGSAGPVEESRDKTR